MKETWQEIVINAAVFLALCVVVVCVGWNEPLRYRFMSEQEIAEVERPPATPAPTPRPSAMEWRSQQSGTSLDRAPYTIVNGKVEYSEGYDSHKTGTATETDTRSGTRRTK